ncbi:hypothetical protein [Chryseobacterium indoltheticum]|uniref:hypothetical protein n=1 Tax=Chryseobacterium indoltheticum TaxID=254 RepID=UPI0028E25E2A|nr:hypothetical protein [Chryseobacterium indoltheticum]
MKKFLDDGFKPYLFPILLAFLAVYFREALDFEPITRFFGDSSSKIANFFNAQLYLWQIILYGVIIYIIVKIYSLIFRSNSKEERKKFRAIRKAPKEHKADFDNGKTYFFKYKLYVDAGDYHFESFTPYCLNCNQEPLRMSRYAYSDYKCNCGSYLGHAHIKDVKSRILTFVEDYE